MAVSGPMALSPECDAFREEFEALSASADALVEPLSDEQFTWQPTPDSWSVALCIDHLNTTAREYLPKLDEGIANAIRRGQYTAGPYRYNWIGRMMVHLVKPTTRMRSKTPQVFVPTPGRRRPEIMAAFRAYQVQYIDRLRQSNGLDLATRADLIARGALAQNAARLGLRPGDRPREAAPRAGAARLRSAVVPALTTRPSRPRRCSDGKCRSDPAARPACRCAESPSRRDGAR